MACLAIIHDGLSVLIQLVLLAARQLQERGQAVEVGHLVEGAQQEVHHHKAHKQIDCSENRGERWLQEVV